MLHPLASPLCETIFAKSVARCHGFGGIEGLGRWVGTVELVATNPHFSAADGPMLGVPSFLFQRKVKKKRLECRTRSCQGSTSLFQMSRCQHPARVHLQHDRSRNGSFLRPRIDCLLPSWRTAHPALSRVVHLRPARGACGSHTRYRDRQARLVPE